IVRTRLDTHFHENLYANAEHAGRQRVAANDLGEKLAVHGHGTLRVRQGDKEPHPNFIGRLAGLKIHATPRHAEGPTDIIEIIASWIGRPDTHELRDFAAAAAPTLGVSGSRRDWIAVAGCFPHEFLPDLHACLSPSPLATA